MLYAILIFSGAGTNLGIGIGKPVPTSVPVLEPAHHPYKNIFKISTLKDFLLIINKYHIILN